MKYKELTADLVRKLLHYECGTGAFSWKESPNRRIRVGSTAGSKGPDGYVRIRIDGANYLAHRLAIIWVTGTAPTDEVDHRDGRPSNNRWTNLREADRKVNSQNQRRSRVDSHTGLLGVSRRPTGKFMARIKVRGKTQYLGTFTTPEQAHQAYLAKKRVEHEGCLI